MRGNDRAMRPFWIHQLAEYLLGVALVAQGLQDPEPLVPALAGGLVAINTAITRGPLGAFKLIGRRAHRWTDLVVMVAIVIGALQPWLAVSSGGRLMLLIALLPIGFLWFYTDWAERVSRRQRRQAATGDRSEAVGRSAGRVAGTAYSVARTTLRNRRQN